MVPALSSVRLVSVMEQCYTLLFLDLVVSGCAYLACCCNPSSHPRVSPKTGCQSIAETPPALPFACHRTDRKVQRKRNCRDIAQLRSESNRSAYRWTKLLHRTGRLPRLHYVDQTWTLVGTAGPKWDPAKFCETYTFNNLHFQTIVPFLQFYLTLKLKT